MSTLAARPTEVVDHPCRWALRATGLGVGTTLAVLGVVTGLGPLIFAGYGLVAGSLASGAV